MHYDQLISEHAGTQNFKSVARIDVFPETYLSELLKLGMGKPAGIFQTVFFQTAFSKLCKFMKFDKIVHKYVNVRLQTTTDTIWCGQEGARGAKVAKTRDSRPTGLKIGTLAPGGQSCWRVARTTARVYLAGGTGEPPASGGGNMVNNLLPALRGPRFWRLGSGSLWRPPRARGTPPVLSRPCTWRT